MSARCWSCGKQIEPESNLDSRQKCPCCSFHSCAICIWGHVRRAHPSHYMKSYVPAVLRARLEADLERDRAYG